MERLPPPSDLDTELKQMVCEKKQTPVQIYRVAEAHRRVNRGIRIGRGDGQKPCRVRGILHTPKVKKR
jgi:hypothetical protein